MLLCCDESGSCDVDCFGVSPAARIDQCDCADENPCTEDGFDPSTRQCVHTPVENGTPCPGFCAPGTCQDGACVSASPPTCDDGDPCTMDICDLATGTCRNPPIDCNDHDPCTRDSCDPQSGQCNHDHISGCCRTNAECDDTAGNPCLIGGECDLCPLCDYLVPGRTCCGSSLPGQCTASRQKPDGRSCDDGSPCTTNDQCENGRCIGRRACSDGKACTDDVCDAGSGTCSFPVHCPDAAPCTHGACDPSTGLCRQ